VLAVTFSVTGLCQLAFSRPAAADCKDPFAHPGQVLDFHVKMSRAEWVKLRDSKVRNVDGLPPNSPACMDDFPELAAEFRCGDEPWIKIGIRKKRGTERGTEVLEKPPLKLDFNEDFMGMQAGAKGQRWPAGMGELGYRKLTLNNGQGNKPEGKNLMLPLLMTEHVALRLLKREVAATPATAYATVTLHTDDKPDGEYHGIYILIEDIDRTAIKRRWGRADGRLSKMTKDNCSPTLEYDDGPPNAAFPAFTAWMNKAAGSGPTWEGETAKVIDLDSLLRQEAIREILVNGDDTISYVTTSEFMKEGNNFYAFDPREGPRQYMPWDVDLTFGQQNGNCAPNNLMCAPTQPLFRYCPDTQSKVGKGTVCNATIQKRYLEVMCQLTNGSMSPGEILKIWEEANTAARPWAAMEKPLWGGQDPTGTVAKSFGAEYERLKKWIPERIKSVQAQINAKGVTCGQGCTAGAEETCTTLGCAGKRRCENGLWTPCTSIAACNVVPPPGGADGGAGSPGDAGTAGPGTGGQGGSAAGGSSGGVSSGGSSGGVSTGGSGTPGGSNGGAPGSASGGSSGRGGSAGSASSGGSAGASPASSGGSKGGCAVAVADGDGRGSALVPFLFGLTFLLARRRRRRGSAA
jgi:MYXO-CTERM domain-containing protein